MVEMLEAFIDRERGSESGETWARMTGGTSGTGRMRVGDLGGEEFDRRGVAPTSEKEGGGPRVEVGRVRGRGVAEGDGDEGGEGVALRGRALGLGPGGVRGRGYAGG